MTTFKEVRESFWSEYPEYKSEYRVTYKQNQYRTDIRVSFCDYVDSLAKNGVITWRLADRITL